MKPQDIEQVKQMIKEALSKAVGFSTRKLGDTPTDSYQLTPQKYVDLNGTRANRPSNPNIGQQYFSTQDKYPWYSDGVSSWFSATGSIVSAL
jgi:hypothetical protein